MIELGIKKLTALGIVHFVVVAGGEIIYIPKAGISSRDLQILLERGDRRSSAVEVCGVASRTPGVEVGLEDFGALDIVGRGHIVSMRNRKTRT